jgi:hypothetical protein
MLNAHSRVAIPEELLYFRSHYAGVPVEKWRSPALSPDAYADVVHDFVSNTTALHPELNATALTAAILEDGLPDLRRPYQTVLNAWAQLNGKERWGEKTPGNLFYVDVILDMFPDAQLLFLARDPRAGVASMQRADFFPNDIVFNALSRRKHFLEARRLLCEHVPRQQWMELRYEDLTADPEATLKQVCCFLGEAFELGMLNYHRTASDYMKEDAATDFNAAATRPVSTDRRDAWCHQLTDAEVAIIESICRDEMDAFGYAPRGVGPTWTSAAEIVVKKGYWHWQLWRHRDIRHYTVKYPIFARSRYRMHQWLGRLRAKTFFSLP